MKTPRERLLEELRLYDRDATRTERAKIRDLIATLARNQMREPRDDGSFGNPWQ
jgi:hypothetical protein